MYEATATAQTKAAIEQARSDRATEARVFWRAMIDFVFGKKVTLRQTKLSEGLKSEVNCPA